MRIFKGFGDYGHQELAGAEDKVIFGGRLGSYKYYDMDQAIGAALEKSKEILGQES